MRGLIIIVLTCLFFSCEKNRMIRAETDERFAILREEISSLPEIPINFYWEPVVKGSLETPPVTTCLTSDVRFEMPYIIANGMKFHAYHWARTENKIDKGLTITSMHMAFGKER